MKRNKMKSIRVRVTENMKIKLQAYMIKHDCTEAEAIRRSLNSFLQTSVANAKAIVLTNQQGAKR